MDARSICLQKICAFQVLLMKGMVPVKRDADKVAGMLAHHALQSIYKQQKPMFKTKSSWMYLRNTLLV